LAGARRTPAADFNKKDHAYVHHPGRSTAVGKPLNPALAEFLREQGNPVLTPGNRAHGHQQPDPRRLVEHGKHQYVRPHRTLLICAARAQLVDEVIAPN
jgi:hypothetical protein